MSPRRTGNIQNAGVEISWLHTNILCRNQTVESGASEYLKEPKRNMDLERRKSVAKSIDEESFPKIITVTQCRLTGKPRLSSNKHLHRCQTIAYGRDYENVCFVGINVPLMSNDTAVNRLYFLSGGASTSEQQSTNRSSSLWSYRIQVKILQFPEALKTDSADGIRVTLYFILFSRRKKK